jgi:hypothetical protein
MKTSLPAPTGRPCRQLQHQVTSCPRAECLACRVSQMLPAVGELSIDLSKFLLA